MSGPSVNVENDEYEIDSDLDMFDDPMNIIFSSSDDDGKDYQTPSKKRKYWVRPYYMDRDSSGGFNTVFNELQKDPQLFYNYTRMNLEQFNELLLLVLPLIEKQTVTREPLCATLRLAVTLRYLATGESQTSLAIAYKCSQTSVHRIVTETTKAITAVLNSTVFPAITKEYFKEVSSGFHDRWNFPNCIGAIDGKHVTIKNPSNSGSEFFNYKKTSSIVLMAICDHDYKFYMCDIGAAGRQSDGGVFRESEFGKAFYGATLPIPEPRDVTERFTDVPYVLVADDAFALTENMLKPYTTMQTNTEKVFNYRLSRARRMIENCFGILCAKWRIFRAPIEADLSLVEDIVQCCVCLHNWLRKKSIRYITPDLIIHEVSGVIVPGSWSNFENNLLPLSRIHRNSTNAAKRNRDKFAKYFSGEGQIEWQNTNI